MSSLNPQTTQSKVLEVLIQLSSAPLSDEFTISRLKLLFKSEVSKLIKIDPAAGYRLLSQEASINWDYDGVVKYFDRAKVINRPSPNDYLNHSISLANVSRYTEAADAAAKYIELDCYSPNFVDNAATAYQKIGNFRAASDIYNRALKSGQKGLSSGHIEGNKIVHQFLDSKGISNESLYTFFHVVERVLQNNKVRCGASFAEVYDDGEHESLAAIFYISVLDNADSTALSWELADRLAEENLDPVTSDLFTTYFMSGVN